MDSASATRRPSRWLQKWRPGSIPDVRSVICSWLICSWDLTKKYAKKLTFLLKDKRNPPLALGQCRCQILNNWKFQKTNPRREEMCCSLRMSWCHVRHVRHVHIMSIKVIKGSRCILATKNPPSCKLNSMGKKSSNHWSGKMSKIACMLGLRPLRCGVFAEYPPWN